MDKDARIAELDAEVAALKKDRADLVSLCSHMRATPKISAQLLDEIRTATVKWGLTLTA